MVGTRIAHYRIEEELGVGGMGVVYRACDTRLDRTVAIKFLSSHLLSDPVARDRLMREARLISALNHPNICTLHEVGEQDGAVYLVMEWVRGRTLSDRIAQGPLPVESVIRYGLGIAEALDHAHSHGVVHRDLKASNIVVLPDGRIKVLDFGLARREASDPAAPAGSFDAAARAVSKTGTTPTSTASPGEAPTDRRASALPAALRLTAEGLMIGTPFAIAPEVLRGGEADARSDLWAMGVLLFEMATGSLPFHGRNVEELAHSILFDPMPSLPARIPPGLRVVIQRCLAKPPGERYQRASEVRAALEAIDSGEHRRVPASEPDTEPRRERPSRRALVFTAVVGVVALAAAAWFLDVGRLRHRGRAATIRSIAVLPFDNLSGASAEDFFADGTTEALITELAQIRALRVTSRTSVMGYKGKSLPLRQIARELGVDAVLEGSVARSGSRVRITAQLIEANTDRHLWAQSYDREMADVLTLQQEVAGDVADRIQLKLSPEERGRLGRKRSINPEVYDLYLKGRFFQNQLDAASLLKAVEYYRQAVAIDPSDARSYSGLADAYAVMTMILSTVTPEEGWPKVREYAEKAIALDPTLADAHTSIGAAYWLADWRWADAERELRRATELNPGYALGRSVLGLMLISVGRQDDGLAEVHRSLELDSLSLFVAVNAQWAYFYARHLDESVAQGEKVLRINPRYDSAHGGLRHARLAQGDYAAAVPHAFAIFPDSVTQPFRVAARAAVIRSGARGYWEVERQATTVTGLDRYWPSWMSVVEAHLGNRDAAFQWMERSIAVHDGNLVFAMVDPLYDDLRSDPRFEATLVRMGLKQFAAP